MHLECLAEIVYGTVPDFYIFLVYVEEGGEHVSGYVGAIAVKEHIA
jgi:hypothetical protein